LCLEQLEDRCCPSTSGYTVTDLGTLGGLGSYAYGINAYGQVTGWAGTSNDSHAFLWTKGGTDGVSSNPQMKDLGTLGGESTSGLPTSEGFGINDAGQVVGFAHLADGHVRAFLWTRNGTGGPTSNPQMQDLGTLLGDTDSYAYGINPTSSDGVQVVGESDGPSGQHAFLWTQKGGMIPLRTLGGTSSHAYGINDVGQVTGDGFIWQNGTPTTNPGSLGGGGTVARAINAGGQVVGASSPKSADFAHGFRWVPTSPNGATGKMTDLGVLKLGLTDKVSGAYGIDDAGDAVGWSGQDLWVFSHAVYWGANGSIKDLNDLIPPNPPGFSLLENATGINDGGQIVGWGYSLASTSQTGRIDHAFLLTPTSGTATAVQIGSFTASSDPVTSGSNLTLTASNITDATPGATITQVAFYYFDGSGTKQVLGDGTPSGTGAWTLTFTVNLGPGIYTLYAQAQDSSDVFSDPLALTLTVL
jgi:probable HAF family extracellular repeat protein